MMNLSSKGKCTIILISVVCVLLISYQHVVDLYVVKNPDHGVFGFNFGFEAKFGEDSPNTNYSSDVNHNKINKQTNSSSSSQNNVSKSLQNNVINSLENNLSNSLQNSLQQGQISPTQVNATTESSQKISTDLVKSSSELFQKTENSVEAEKTRSPGNLTSHCLPKNSSLPPCPPIPARLVGRLKVDLETPSWSDIANVTPGVRPGGEFSPPSCVAKDRVAVVLPYRNRPDQLKTFLKHIHPILMRQDIHYQIFIVNQAGDITFNRAMLFNVGFVEASKICDWDCVVFHDVDLLPEDDRNLYTCPEQPRHLSVAVNKFNYKLPYSAIFGGAGVLTKQHFKLVNGFSNQFWGWGGEDDNMSDRIRHHGLKITRYKNDIARYTMIKHKTEASNKANPQRFNLLKTSKKDFDKDGLSNIQYKLVSLEFEQAYTNITVIIDKVKI